MSEHSRSPQPAPSPASPSPGLAKRLVAEALGTALLVPVVVGSGIMAQRLSDDVGLHLLANSTAIVLGLTVLILVFSGIAPLDRSAP